MNLITLFVERYESLVYVIIFFAVLIEGDISLLVFGALSRSRAVHFSQALPIAIAAAIIHDVLFWRLGGYLSRMKRKKFLFLNFEKMGTFLDQVKSNIGLYILLSKFAWNFNRVVLVSSGYIGTQFDKLIRYSLISACLWVTSFMSLGYVFADQTRIFRQRIEVSGLLMMGIVIAIILFEIYLKKTLKRIFFSSSNKLTTDPSVPPRS